MVLRQTALSLAQKMMEEDLKRSGLSRIDAKKRGLKALVGEEVREYLCGNEERGFRKTIYPSGYWIPYYSPFVKESLYGRIRFNEDYRPKGAKKVQRYSQPQGTKPEIYFDPTINWKSVLSDLKEDIYIFEGEKKGMVACKLGYTAIAIGGVWNWMADGEPIESIVRIPWKNRKAIIVFDNDIQYKPDLMRARDALRNFLIKAGALPFAVDLPDGI
jgi:hypothetical protein